MTTEATARIETAPAPSPAAEVPFVPQPQGVEETGIDLSLLVDLMLKAIYFAGRPSARYLSEYLALPFPVIEETIAFLRQEQAIEIVGSTGVGEQGYQYALTGRGTEKVDEALGRNHYVGPAPVPLDLYIDVLGRQSVSHVRIDRDTYLRELSDLVLSRRVLAALGPAVSSGRSVLIYGASGNGKSTISFAIGRMLPGAALIPYAVEVHGQIIKVFDARLHQPLEAHVTNGQRQEAGLTSLPDYRERRRDQRWVLAKRPLVTAGGELTLQDLELRYSPLSKFYIAPLQWKANGGILIVDDFGRQMVQPKELLNRWIVPMEQGVDHLSLQTGDTVEIPFDILLVFSTNIPPGDLGDEAFFRRIRHKVEIPNPTREEFLEILRRVCQERDLPYSDEGAEYLAVTYYEQAGRDFRGCHPRDLVDLLIDIFKFYGEKPALTPEWIDLACASYFVELGEAE